MSRRSRLAFGLAASAFLAAGPSRSPAAEGAVVGGRPALTRADAEAWLSALERAYAGEDLEAAVALSGTEELRRLARYQLGRLFEERNHLRLEHRIEQLLPLDDGGLEVEVIETLRSRPAEGRSDQREKSRRRQRLARIDGRVVLSESLEAAQPELPPFGRWVAEEWVGEVSLHPRPRVPFGSPEGRADVELSVRLRNVSPEVADELSFGLHPFARDLILSTGDGEALRPHRQEGAADVWTLELPRPVPAGAAVELRLAYAIDELGIGAHSRIGPGGAHLFPESAWYPLLAPTPLAGIARASHDLTVEVPAGWSAVAPGALAGRSEVDGGRRRFRYVSRFPGEGLALVAGELEESEIRASPSLVVELWRQRGRGSAPAELGERLASMERHLESLLGAPPVDRVVLVETLGPGLRRQPGFLCLGELDPRGAELFERDAERQPLFFLAHHLAHLWLVDGMRPVGGPAQVLSEALCDQLAFDWMDAAIDPRISHWHRDRILQYARARPEGDRPLIVAQPADPAGEIFGRGKGLVVLDGLRDFAGRERWAGLLRELVQARRGQQVGVSELLEALSAGDPRLEDYVATWIVGQGYADIVVAPPSAREIVDERTGERSYAIELEVANEGLGPVPLGLRFLTDRPGAEWVEQRLELGTHERTLLRFTAAAPLRMVEADAEDRTWQAVARNDDFPEKRQKAKTLPGQERAIGDDDQARLNELLRR